ncbi:MAG: transglycosylase SLT domain-containing protein [Bacteroidales bacterium]|jgi:membrane-bound lytic murein transglycosylase D|nr:transglycosylase SLT domain-containing protein [Bacteroidales bacterium]
MNKFIITFIFSLFISVNIGKTQDISSLIILPGDSIVDIEFAMPDIEEPLIEDENLDVFFSEMMDSMVNSWFIDNILNGNTEINQTGTFPKDLPDSIYIQRLQKTQQVISLSYNNIVKNLIRMYSEQRRDQVEIMLGLSSYYFPLFEEILDKYNLPLELKYLPVIESALNPKAMSRAGANGLWQFIYSTGRNMDLKITSFIDERCDPVKSTDAAARYLKSLYEKYNDWHLTLAAYNCGPGNVDRAIQRSGNKTGYWDIYYRLPRETRGYVPAYIAATYIMNYYKEHYLIPRVPKITLVSDTVHVADYIHFDQIAATLGMEKEELRSLNPMYRRDVIPARTNETYPLVLPQEKISEFIYNDTIIFAWERDKYFPNNMLVQPTENLANYVPVDVKGKAIISYTVQQGDNVGYISSWFNVRTSDLNYWNNISRNLIRAGQKLVIYVPENQKEKYEKVNSMTFAQKQEMIGKSISVATKTNLPDPNYEYYTVKKGDTLWDIAEKYAGISSNEIMQLNNLKDGRGLYIGQQIKIKRKG